MDQLELTPQITVSGSKLVLVDYRISNNNSKIVISMKNYSSTESQTVQIGSLFLVGKTVLNLFTENVIVESCNGTFSYTISPEGYELFLAYEPQENINPEGDVPSEGEEDFDNNQPQESTGEGEDSFSEEPSQENLSEEEKSSSGKTEDISSVSSTNTTDTQTTTDETENVSSTVTSTETGTNATSELENLPASVFLLERDNNFGSSTQQQMQHQTSSEIPTAEYRPIRTYLGKSYRGTSTSEQPKSMSEYRELKPLHTEEGSRISPMEQFRTYISNRNEIATPVYHLKSTTPEKVKEILSQPQRKSSRKIEQRVNAKSSWINKMIDWVNNIKRKLNLHRWWSKVKESIKLVFFNNNFPETRKV